MLRKISQLNDIFLVISSFFKKFQMADVNVTPFAESGEQNAAKKFKATVKYANKFSTNALAKLFVKIIIPKVNLNSEENSFETGIE